MPEHKRRRYIVKRLFQLKYIGIILLFILLTIFLAGAITYYTIFPYLSEKLANVYPQSRLISILAVSNLRLFYASLALIPIAVWIGIALSHKIAGPLYRLENILLDMARGNMAEDIRLRKGDELKSLADAINKVTASLRTDKSQDIKKLYNLQLDLSKLREELDRAQPDVARAKQLMSNLQDSVNSLKSR
ncbi:MAG: hypothetical protein JSW18_02635 [Candidatus Omnitrophota bacterium]|nr:MAG: hypothetical protein JSW18_02635 [Candidatus Omnitrophota bacterium]